MDVYAAQASPDPGEPRSAGGNPSPDWAVRTLRSRWRAESMAAGWRFPGDWELPEVDAVCAAVLRHGEAKPAEHALAGLARARAMAGTGLEETLADLSALHGVLTGVGAPVGDAALDPDVAEPPSRLVRVAAVSWAEVALEQVGRGEVCDPLTGLPTAAYLRARLAELYRQAARHGTCVAEGHALVVVSMSFEESAGWTRLAGLILAADALKTTFDGGESLAVLGPATVAAVVPRAAGVASGAVRLRREFTQSLAVDTDVDEAGAPRVNVVRMPAGHEEACALLDRLGRR